MTDSTAPARMIPMTLQQIEELLPLARSISSVDAWDAWCAVILQWSYAANAEIGRLRNMVAELERELADYRSLDTPTAGPICRVINNNQPGWTMIVETAPNVTISVGEPLYERADVDRLIAALGGAIHRAETAERELAEARADIERAIANHSADLSAERASAEAEPTQAQIRHFLQCAEIELSHARTFVTSREKMHSIGIEQYDMVLNSARAINAALRARDAADQSADQPEGEG